MTCLMVSDATFSNMFNCHSAKQQTTNLGSWSL